MPLTWLTALVVIAIAAIALAVAVARLLERRLRYRSWVRVTGTVIRFGYLPAVNRPSPASYEFTGPDGVVRQGRTTFGRNPRHHPIGSPIAILVDPAAPHRHCEDTIGGRYGQELLLAALAAMLAAAGLLIACIGRLYA